MRAAAVAKPPPPDPEKEFWLRQPGTVTSLTGDGFLCCRLVPLYGQLIDAAGEQHRAACEARHILMLPAKTDREARIEFLAKKRGGSDDGSVAWWRAKLKRDVTREWEWRRSLRPQEGTSR